MEKNQNNQENHDSIFENLENFVNSYLRAILIVAGLITLGLGSTFFGDKVLGIGGIIFVLGLFCNSFNGLIRRTIHLALSAFLLVAVTAHLVVSKLGDRVRDRIVETRLKVKATQTDDEKADSAAGDDQKEQRFQRIVLDGDIEDGLFDEEVTGDAEPEFVAAMKPKFNANPIAASIPDEFSDEPFNDYEVFSCKPEDNEPAIQYNMESDIPDEEATDNHAFEQASRPVIAKARRVSTLRLPNGTCIVARTAVSE